MARCGYSAGVYAPIKSSPVIQAPIKSRPVMLSVLRIGVVASRVVLLFILPLLLGVFSSDLHDKGQAAGKPKTGQKNNVHHPPDLGQSEGVNFINN